MSATSPTSTNDCFQVTNSPRRTLLLQIRRWSTQKLLQNGSTPKFAFVAALHLPSRIANTIVETVGKSLTRLVPQRPWLCPTSVLRKKSECVMDVTRSSQRKQTKREYCNISYFHVVEIMSIETNIIVTPQVFQATDIRLRVN